ncbi:MAG: ABC transporter permease, partial [Acidobacteriota bacterium]
LISTLLMNYPARLVASYLVSGPLRDVASGLPQTNLIPTDARLPALASGRVHLGLPIVVGLALALFWLFRRTVVGYRMRMVGLNPRFANYGGIEVDKLGRRVMLASGALAGVIGAVQVLAVHFRFIDGALTKPLYAWTGLMVALLARSRPLAILAMGFFFAAIQTGGFGMERAVEVPRELSQVIQALIILFVAVGARRKIRDLEAGEAL